MRAPFSTKRGYVQTAETHNLLADLSTRRLVDSTTRRATHADRDRVLDFIEREFGRIWRFEAATPEHINDGANTHPSARLKNLLKPRYDKVLYGSGIATLIGLPPIRSECRHFDEWLARIESLQALP